MSVGKISYNFPFIPLTTMALKKMRNMDTPDSEGTAAIQASGTRLVIDPSQSLGDMSAADLEKLMSTDNVPGGIDTLFFLL